MNPFKSTSAFMMLKNTFCKSILNNSSGYVIQLVLIVITILTISFSISLYANRQTHLHAIHELQKTQAYFLAESGVKRAEFFLNGGDGHDIWWETDNLQEHISNYGSISLQATRFGAFLRIVSKGERLQTKAIYDGFLGQKIPDELTPVLVMTGRSGDLALEEGSKIEGKVIIAGGTLRSGHRGAKIYNADKFVSSAQMPELPFDFSKYVEFFKINYSLVNSPLPGKILNGLVVLDSLNTKDDTISISGDCHIKGYNLYKKQVYVNGELFIDNRSIVNNCQFFAKKIRILDCQTDNSFFFSSGKIELLDGTHNSQYFSCDTLRVNQKPKFKNASVFFNYRQKISKKGNITGGIIVNNNNDIIGTAISISDSLIKPQELDFSITVTSSIFDGVIISNADLFMLNSTINGSSYIRSIGSFNNIPYVNVLWGCNFLPLKKQIDFPLLGGKKVELQMRKLPIIYSYSKQKINSKK